MIVLWQNVQINRLIRTHVIIFFVYSCSWDSHLNMFLRLELILMDNYDRKWHSQATEYTKKISYHENMYLNETLVQI